MLLCCNSLTPDTILDYEPANFGFFYQKNKK